MKMYMCLVSHLIVANSKQEAINHFLKDSGTDDIPTEDDINEVDAETMSMQKILNEDTGEKLTYKEYLNCSNVPHYVCDTES